MIQKQASLNKNNHKYIIPLDGPTSAGTSSIGRTIVMALNEIFAGKWGFISAGNLYRALTWYGLNYGLPPQELNKQIREGKIDMTFGAGQEKIIVNSVTLPTKELNSFEVNNNVANYASQKELRDFLESNLFKKVTESEISFVIEGRNMRHLFSGHELISLYLYTDIDTRARRRYIDILNQGEDKSLEEVKEMIISKDEKDYTRKIAPMTRPETAEGLYGYAYNNKDRSIPESRDHMLLVVLKKIYEITHRD